MEYLTDERVQPLRDVFRTYELLAYLSVRATQLGMRACEIPVTRALSQNRKDAYENQFFQGQLEPYGNFAQDFVWGLQSQVGVSCWLRFANLPSQV